MTRLRVRATTVLFALTLLPLASMGPAGGAHEPDCPETPGVDVLLFTGATQTCTGNQANGSNVEYNFSTGEPCVEDPTMPSQYCDLTLLQVDLADDFWDTRGGGIQIRLDQYETTGMAPSPASDFDLQIWTSNAAGDKGSELVGSSGNPPGSAEQATVSQPADGYYLIQVVYFAVTNSYYHMTLDLAVRDEVPPDVDVPPGLQEVLASTSGFTSYSEPHIAQNPLNPKILVAGSKFYNKDPHALQEYEFKIGTFVSFNGGKTWTDLGQLKTCPHNEAPESTWPFNTCYPVDNPDRGGTGPEDDGDRGNDDFGEEYITSDIWLHFDDEGNAYAMVLDAPPFESEARWGMTMHRWNSVSKSDLDPGGNTWSNRKPINLYDNIAQDFLGFLDDKNTFAVQNAGPDDDGTTGPLVACWGQNVSAAIKQQVACRRSMDRGDTWEPQDILSGVHQLVIGVHVIADPVNPNVFYATWLQYETEIATGVGTLDFNVSVDGGNTWLPTPITITDVQTIPRQFPGQSFRNLSIPIMAAGPDGELYIAIAEYLDAPQPDDDEDGMQADIILYKSTNGGFAWDGGTNVTEELPPNVNADQFQPYIDIVQDGNGKGQVNLAYFDRRLDEREGSGPDDHPGNYFTDVFLSRSNDGGENFSHLRLTHDATDPEFNAPVSGSGLFFGDYQGLVVDDCRAVPFFNDTHLANDAFIDPASGQRDPDFDDGLPASQYQQAVNWRVPNTTEFGGTRNQACTARQEGGGDGKKKKKKGGQAAPADPVEAQPTFTG